jgi:hypothetical protein
VPEIHAILRQRGVAIAERSVTNLLDRYDEVGFLPESGGVRSEYQAASRIVTASMLARASAGVR